MDKKPIKDKVKEKAKALKEMLAEPTEREYAGDHKHQKTMSGNPHIHLLFEHFHRKVQIVYFEDIYEQYLVAHHHYIH